MKNIISRFTIHLERLGYSKRIVQGMPVCVKDFLETEQVSAPEKVRPAHIEHYHNHLQQRPNKRRPGGLSESHIYHHIYALKTFFKWLEANGKLSANPISALTFPSPKYKAREILAQEEIQQLYEACENYRERAVLSVYYGCGLRRSEGVKLNTKDIHYSSGLLYVRDGKGAKRRVVPMSRGVINDFRSYLYKERKAMPGETAFLIGHTGRRMSGDGARRIIKNLLSRSNIKKDIALHSLRHSIATHLLENGLKVEEVRDFLGHRYLESTQIYTRISKQQLGKL